MRRADGGHPRRRAADPQGYRISESYCAFAHMKLRRRVGDRGALRIFDSVGLKIQWHVTNFIEEPCECRRVRHESTLVHGCPVNGKTSQRTGAALSEKNLRLVDRRLQAVEVSAQQPSLCLS